MSVQEPHADHSAHPTVVVASVVSARARGTDFVRLRPASASVRFLEILPVRRPNSSLRRTDDVRPPSASVRFGNIFSVRRPNPSLRRTEGVRPPSASVRLGNFVYRPLSECVLEADERGASAVRMRPLETVRIGQASAFVRFRLHWSALVHICPPSSASVRL